MIEQLYQNIRDGKGILFDFLFEELTITAKFEEWNCRNYIRKIVACKRKKINCNDIIVNHPGLVEYEEDEGDGTTETRNTKRKNSSDLGEGKQLVSNLAATTNTIDIEEDNLIISEYSTFAKIKRIKVSQRPGKTAREIESDDIIGTNKRTTADFGGLETVPQLEFSTIFTEKLEGNFKDIQAILQLMEKRKEVVKIEYYIGTLNDHLRYRVICTLDDGKTPRKYLIGKIKLHNGCEAVLIEIQRESLTLSTLVCMSHDLQKWNRVCHKILKGLIEKSGVWPDFKEIGLDALVNYRFRHTNVEIIRKEKRIFEKIFVNHL